MESLPENQKIKFRLARVLGLSDATFIGIGAIIGGGIFTLTGLALSFAGSSLILVIGLNGLIAFMTALTYAELGSTFPEAGGGFIWVKKGLGNLAGHISGWISWFAHAVACGLYSLSFGFYFGTILFSLILPIFGVHFSFAEGDLFQKLVAVSIILFVGWVNYRGVSGTGRLGKIIVYLEILILSTFVTFGLISFFKKPDIAASFIPLFPMGIFGLFSAMSLMYIGFEGTEIIVQSGEELKNPKKNLPRAIFISLGVICLLYLLTIFSALAGVRGESPSWEILSQAGQGALVKASSFFMPGFEWIMLFGGLLAAGAALNATVFSSSHVSFAMGRSGNLPNLLAKIHPKNKTPHIAIIISTLLVLGTAVFLPLKDVAAIADLLFIFLFAQLHFALIALRKKLPDVERPFRVPLYPLPSIIAIFAYLILIYQFFHISPIGLGIALIWILSGLVIYYAYSKPVEIEKIEREILFEEKLRTTAKKKDKIILPLYPSYNWQDILILALALARAKNAEIDILYIKKIPRPLPLQIKEEILKEDKEFLEKVLNLSKDSGINVDVILMMSRSFSKAILEIIEREKPVLLVLGWKGYTRFTTFRHQVFGRNLDEILREANCNLIVARLNHLRDLKSILIPCLGSPHHHFTQGIAEIIAKEFGSKISELIYDENSPPRLIARQIVQEGQNYGCIMMASAKSKVFREMVFGNIPEMVTKNSSRSILLVKEHKAIIKPIISYFQSKF